MSEEIGKSRLYAYDRIPVKGAASTVAFMGLLFALAIVLSLIESMLPALPALPPGVKMGLSNIVIMYCLFLMGRRYALTITILKSLFVLLTRGAVASFLSLSGGLLSVFVMILALLPKRDPFSYLLISIFGAIAHNAGQLLAASFLIHSAFALYYLPLMVLSGTVMGIVTGIVLRVLMPYVNTVGNTMKRKNASLSQYLEPQNHL